MVRRSVAVVSGLFVATAPFVACDDSSTPSSQPGAAEAGSIDVNRPPSDASQPDTAIAPVDAGSDAAFDVEADAPCTVMALRFTNVTDTVTIPDSASLDMGTAGTIEAWVYREPLTADAGTWGWNEIYNKWKSGSEDTELSMSDTGKIWGFVYPGGSGSPGVEGATASTTGKWLHAAYVYDANGRTVYLDGVADGTIAGGVTPLNSDAPAQIGGIFRDGSQTPPLHGFIADVRISGIARYTATFVPQRQLTADADTKALWKLDEGTGATVLDKSGNANTGTISGATWAPVACR